MSEEKQIEEMAKDICSKYTICTCNDRNGRCSTPRQHARIMYELGYRKQIEGEWEKHIDEYDCEYAQCSCCGEEYYDASGEDTIDMFYNFCPNCGAKMKGV